MMKRTKSTSRQGQLACSGKEPEKIHIRIAELGQKYISFNWVIKIHINNVVIFIQRI